MSCQFIVYGFQGMKFIKVDIKRTTSVRLFQSFGSLVCKDSPLDTLSTDFLHVASQLIFAYLV